MTELQNNDLVSKLGAATPVEPMQANQINLSDNEETISANQSFSNEETLPNVSTESPSLDTFSSSVEDVINEAVTPSVEMANDVLSENNISGIENEVTPQVTTIVSNNEAPTPTPENIETNNVVPKTAPVNELDMSKSMDNLVNTEPQKVSNITGTKSKRNPRAEYWKGLASGILVSIGLIVVGLILFDNGSLLVSASNNIKLTNNDTTNEVVKMEDAITFSDSISNSYIDGIINGSEEEVILNHDNLEIDVQTGKNEISDDSEDKGNLKAESDLDTDLKNSDDLNDKEVAGDQKDSTSKELDDKDNDTKLMTKNSSDDTLDNEKSNDTSTKNRMAGSIVSIFDDMDEDVEGDEIEDIDNTKTPSVSFKHVDNVEDANWVMSKNCNNLHCGDLSNTNLDDLIPCTEFRQSDKLDDNANRIGKNGVCKYKDISELVYVDLD